MMDEEESYKNEVFTKNYEFFFIFTNIKMNFKRLLCAKELVC